MFLPPGQVTPFLCAHFLCPIEQISRDQQFAFCAAKFIGSQEHFPKMTQAEVESKS
jgi:hypothetical protein